MEVVVCGVKGGRERKKEEGQVVRSQPRVWKENGKTDPAG